MHILYWQQNPVFGACEEYLANVAAAVARHTKDLEVAVDAPETMIEAWVENTPNTVAVRRHRTGFVAVLSSLSQFRPDVLHVNDPAIPVLVLARVWRVSRVVLTWHTPSHSVGWSLRARLALWFALRNPALTVATLSETNKRTLEAKYPYLADVRVIPPAVDLEPFLSIHRLPKHASEESVTFVTAARFAPQKNLPLLIEAFSLARARLASSGIEATLVLVGDGEERSALMELAERMAPGRVRFPGWTSDVAGHFKHSDVFVMSSDFEGLPFAALQAAASGLPLVVPAVDGLRDLVTPKSGLLVAPRSPSDLADALHKAGSSPNWRVTAGEAARRSVRGHYQPDVVGAKMLSLYCLAPFRDRA